MQQVLIEFAADTSGMAPADKAISTLTDAEKKLMDQSTKTATAITAQGKATTDSAKAGTKSVEQLVSSMKNIDKAMIGGAYKKTFDDIRKNLSMTDTELKKFYQNIIANSRVQLLDSNLAKEDFDALHQLVMSAQSAMDQLGDSEEVVGEKSQSMRARLKELKIELQQLEDQGKDNTEEFETMAIEAGKLTDQIGDTNARIAALASDTFPFDAIASGITGVAGGFAVAQGAAALFGNESEEVQQALLKVNAAMAILQGLQTVQNTLQAQSSAMIGLNVLRTQALAISQRFLAATTLESAAATGVLRTALIASGIGAIAVVVGLLAVGFSQLNEDIEDSADRFKRLNDEAESTYEALLKLSKISQKGIDRQIDIIQNEELAKLLEAQGASLEKINEVKKAGLRLQNEQLKVELFSLEQSQKTAEDKTLFTQRELEIKGQIYQNDKAQLLLDIESAKVANDRALKSATGFADAEVARRKKAVIDNQIDSIASIEAISKAERNAIRAKLNEELKSNKGMTEGERAKAIADANLAISENFQETRSKLFLFRKDSILAELALVKEGSQQELDLQLRLLTQEQTAELNATEVTKQKSIEIENRYQKQRADLIKQYNRQVAEDTINAQLADTNSQLSNIQTANLSATNAELFRLKKDQIDQQAALEVISVDYSEKNEELRRVKIKSIYDKALADKRALEEAKLKTEIEQDDKFMQQVYRLSALQQQAILNNNQSTEEQKKEAARQINVFNESISGAELAALEDEHNLKLISEEEYLNRLFELKLKKQQEANDVLLQEAQIFAQKEQIIRDTAFNVANQLVDALTDNQQANNDFELQQVKDLYDQKLISEKEYNNRQKLIKRQAAIAEREAALFQIFLDTQQKAMAIQAQRAAYLSNPVTAPLAALASTQLISLYITAGITAALVAARKLPAFRHGGIDIQGPGTGTSDSILARLSRGETVTTAEKTKKYRPALEAIHNDKFEEYLRKMAPKFYPAMPIAPTDVTNLPLSINYELMAKTLGDELSSSISKELSKELANNPMLFVKFDKDGMNTYLQQQNSITEIKNRDFEL